MEKEAGVGPLKNTWSQSEIFSVRLGPENCSKLSDLFVLQLFDWLDSIK